jgi:hypothetical protein
VSSPTWGVDGVTFNGSNSIGISTAVGSSRVNKFAIGVGKITGYSSNRFFDIQDGSSNTRRNPFLGLGSFGSFDTIFSLPNSGVSAPEANAYTSNLPQNTYYSVIGRTTGSSMFVYRDKVQKGTLAGQTFNQGSPYNSAGIGVGYTGTIAFVALAGEDTTESQAFALNDLYYSTLGNNRDADVDSYILRAGVTDSTAQTQINDFVVGVKALGLWNKMVCWPLRSAQNAGTGSIAYSLGGLGTYNGTLNAQAIWTADGVDLTSDAPAQITTTAGATQPNTILSIQKYSSSIDTFQVAYDGTTRQHHYKSANTAWAVFAGVNAGVGSPTNDSFSSVQVKFNSTNGKASINGGAESTYNFGTNNLTNFRMGGGQRGTIQAFAMIVNADTSENFYNLYKTTLGSGLGLP